MYKYLIYLRQAYKQRLETKQRKNDLIDLIIDELKKSGNVDDGQKSAKTDPEDEFEANAALGATSGEDNVKFDDEEVVLIANALLFFFAGFDTTSTGFGMVCHKLCMYPVSDIFFIGGKRFYSFFIKFF